MFVIPIPGILRLDQDWFLEVLALLARIEGSL